MERMHGTTGTRSGAARPAQGVDGGTGSVKDAASDAVEKAGAKARERIEEGKHDVARTLETVASSLHDSSSKLRSEDEDLAGKYVDRAAREVEKLAGYLESTDLDDMVEQLEDIARRKPAVFLGAAFAAGVLGARFLKSSSRNAVEGRNAAAGREARVAEREVTTVVAVEARPVVVATPAPGATLP
jgi:hypothetical protein